MWSHYRYRYSVDLPCEPLGSEAGSLGWKQRLATLIIALLVVGLFAGVLLAVARLLTRPEAATIATQACEPAGLSLGSFHVLNLGSRRVVVIPVDDRAGNAVPFASATAWWTFPNGQYIEHGAEAYPLGLAWLRLSVDSSGQRRPCVTEVGLGGRAEDLRLDKMGCAAVELNRGLAPVPEKPSAPRSSV